jgi:hypothetical protein
MCVSTVMGPIVKNAKGLEGIMERHEYEGGRMSLEGALIDSEQYRSGEVNPHTLGYCCRYACGETCIGCGDEMNGDRT